MCKNKIGNILYFSSLKIQILITKNSLTIYSAITQNGQKISFGLCSRISAKFLSNAMS